MSRKLPEPMLEALHQRELPADVVRALETDLSAADRERLAALAADDAATLLRHPPARMAAAVEARLGRTRPRRAMARWAFALGTTAAAAAALFVAFGGPGSPVPTEPPTPLAVFETVRAKGDDRLLVFRRTDAAAEPLTPGAPGGTGDELRLGVLLDAPARAVIVSLDGRGAVTRHVPTAAATTADAPAVLPRGRTLLDFAYALDDAPEFERFVLVTGPEVRPGEVESAARAIAGQPDADRRPLPLPEGWRQVDFLVRKTQPEAGPRSPRP